MAERLTEKSIGCFEYDLANFEHKVKEFNDYDAFFAYSIAVKKLGQFEDIMEKYGIESVEGLQELLQCLNACFINSASSFKTKFEKLEKDIKYFANRNGEYYEKLCEMTKDRDTWKKVAKELGDTLRELNYKFYNEDRVDFENILYQQAKEKQNSATTD